ncbi:MAG: GSCFA domain-containing protein [Mangrovibacterium sp.]
MIDKYFTQVKIGDIGWRISYEDKLMMMGSCFAENIGEKLQQLKFQVDLNPFGVIYNPLSVAKSLRRLLADKPYTKGDLFEHQGLWGSFDHHSRFSATSAEEALAKMNLRLEQSKALLKEAGYLFITFGTAWVYELKATGEIVSNCHKFPEADFKRFRLTPGEIVDVYRDLLSALWTFNPNLKIIFTVSPIRHWKDGATGNQLSKAALLLASDRLVTGFGDEHCAYFPSYEIVMDELRDYRFYAPDLLHLNQVAIDHIWDKFSQAIITKESLRLSKSILKIMKALEHRPFFPDSDTYKYFLLNHLNEINELTISFPYLNLEEEKSFFQKELQEYH